MLPRWERGVVDATTAVRIFENFEKEIFLYAARTFNYMFIIFIFMEV